MKNSKFKIQNGGRRLRVPFFSFFIFHF